VASHVGSVPLYDRPARITAALPWIAVRGSGMPGCAGGPGCACPPGHDAQVQLRAWLQVMLDGFLGLAWGQACCCAGFRLAPVNVCARAAVNSARPQRIRPGRGVKSVMGWAVTCWPTWRGFDVLAQLAHPGFPAPRPLPSSNERLCSAAAPHEAPLAPS
jgi:hypothetical protein